MLNTRKFDEVVRRRRQPRATIVVMDSDGEVFELYTVNADTPKASALKMARDRFAKYYDLEPDVVEGEFDFQYFAVSPKKLGK